MNEVMLIKSFEMFILEIYMKSRKSFYDYFGSFNLEDKEGRDFLIYTVKHLLELRQKDLVAILNKEHCESSERISDLIIKDFLEKFERILKRQRNHLNFEEFISKLKISFMQIVKDNQFIN